MTPLYDWYVQKPSWAEKARMFWDSMGDFANTTIATVFFGIALATAGCFGFVIGEKSKAACPAPSRSVDVLSYRDPKTGVIVCELSVAKYYVPGMRDQ